MTLDQATIGVKYQVVEILLEEKIGGRLRALGLTDGTRIELLNRRKNGVTILKVRSTRLAVGTQIASAIVVKEDQAWSLRKQEKNQNRLHS